MDPRIMRMDAEFDKYLVSMKPFVLRLARKTGRLFIKTMFSLFDVQHLLQYYKTLLEGLQYQHNIR